LYGGYNNGLTILVVLINHKDIRYHLLGDSPQLLKFFKQKLFQFLENRNANYFKKNEGTNNGLEGILYIGSNVLRFFRHLFNLTVVVTFKPH